MSDTITYYKGVMTLEDFREIVRDLQSQGVAQKRYDPFEYMHPNLRAEVDEAFRGRLLEL